jgi:hypothetical protein
MEKITAPAHAIKKWKNSLRKKIAPMIEPIEKTSRMTQRAPPHTVKSHLVWKAKIVRAMTMAAVRATA